MEITLATLSDIPQLLPLLESLFSQEQEFVPDNTLQLQGLEQIIRNRDVGDILVATENNTVVGMVSLLYTISTALGGKVALLEDMIVSPGSRGMGVGTSLLQQAQKHAQLVGCKRITLLTDQVNTAAHRFYERHGFSRSSMLSFRKLF